jgi:hypothetical protein
LGLQKGYERNYNFLIMKNWLYIEPYTLLFKTDKECLLYNTLDGSKLIIPVNGKNRDLLYALAEQKCIAISDTLADHQTLSDIIALVQNTFNGDVIPIENDSCRPAVFKPIINNQRAFEKLDTYDWININSEVMNYLEEVFIYINGGKQNNLRNIKLFNQIHSYIESNLEIDSQLLAEFFKRVIDKQINRINILGGNIMSHAFLSDIIRIMREKAHIINFHFRFDEWKAEYKKVLESKFDELTIICPICLLMENPFNLDGLFNQKYAKKTKYIFIIQNEKEYKRYEEIVSNNPYVIKYRCLPLFNGSNIKFFEEIIYSDESDIEDIKLTKREVYSNQKINNIDFGRITILPNGAIYANVNHPPIGDLRDKIHDVLYNELKFGRSWLQIRDMEPCCHCVYQFLCPPPSNYELVIGRPNLCHIHP